MSVRLLIDAIYSDDLVKVQLILAKATTVNSQYNGLLPLVETAKFGNVEIARVLLEHSANVDETDGQERTALTVACELAQLKMATLLIGHSANVNFLIRKVATPLSKSASGSEKNRLQIAKSLIAAGADPTTKFHSIDGRCVSNVLMSACRAGSSEMIRLLIDIGAPINEQHFFGTPLIRAVIENRPQIVELLLSLKADSSIRLADDSRLDKDAGKTATEIANSRGFKRVAKLLQAS